MERDWRKKLATLLASLERIWGLKTRVALGATVASIVSLAALPAARAEAKTDSTEIAATAPLKPGKLAGKFLLRQAGGRSGRTQAEHGSHSSHSSHSSHRSGAWLL